MFGSAQTFEESNCNIIELKLIGANRSLKAVRNTKRKFFVS